MPRVGRGTSSDWLAGRGRGGALRARRTRQRRVAGGEGDDHELDDRRVKRGANIYKESSRAQVSVAALERGQ